MNIAENLERMGLELPPVPEPVGSYVPAVASGHLIFTAGQLPVKDGALTAVGKVPSEVSIAEAKLAARQAALNALAAAASVAGGVEKINRIVRVNVFVACADGFDAQAEVANGASELLGELFGDAGRHSRCAIGAAMLPKNAPVELDLICEAR
jgi:enamine deaminase RidA (YjgF/YER057c/UK114 family)